MPRIIVTKERPTEGGYEVLEPLYVRGLGLAYGITSNDLTKTGMTYPQLVCYGNGDTLYLQEEGENDR